MHGTVHDRWQEWNDVEPIHPAVRVPEPLPGTAFFPGGYGLWRPPKPKDSDACFGRRVMVVGHNFGAEKEYYDLKKAEVGEDTSDSSIGTWGPLLRLLRSAGIDEADCYYTNVFVGLKAGNRNKGPFDGHDDVDFIRRCEASLSSQLSVVRPKVVIAMGMEAVPFLAKMSPSLSLWIGPRGGYRTMPKIDDHNGGLVESAVFVDAGVTACAVPIYHPCDKRNAADRRFGALSGSAAETALLREANLRAR